MSRVSPPPLMTLPEVAERLALPVESVRVLIRRRSLVAVNVGHGKRLLWRVDPKDLDTYVAQRRTKPLAVRGRAS